MPTSRTGPERELALESHGHYDNDDCKLSCYYHNHIVSKSAESNRSYKFRFRWATECTKIRILRPQNYFKKIAHKRLTDAATRCSLRPVDASKCVCGWGSAPDPAGGAHSTPPDPL